MNREHALEEVYRAAVECATAWRDGQTIPPDSALVLALIAAVGAVE